MKRNSIELGRFAKMFRLNGGTLASLEFCNFLRRVRIQAHRRVVGARTRIVADCEYYPKINQTNLRFLIVRSLKLYSGL